MVMPAMMAMISPELGTAAKLIPMTSAPTRSTDRTPPRLSTGSVPSLTWAGTSLNASSSATTARGSVIRKTEPHQKCSSRSPDSSGPSEAMAAPMPDHRAIERVRPGPDQSAVIRASVVGKAMPAERPPPTRATNSTCSLGDQAASTLKGMASAVPMSSISLRP